MTTPSPLAELSASLADLAAATTPSIVEVQSRHSLASGFVWRDGLVITPDETLADAKSVPVQTGPKSSRQLLVALSPCPGAVVRPPQASRRGQGLSESRRRDDRSARAPPAGGRGGW